MDPFKFAASVRYLDDTRLKLKTVDSTLLQNYEAGLALNSLKISKEITPDLQRCLEKTCENLFLDVNKVNAYVTSSPEIQAGCMSFNKESCVITLTSAVINLLDLNEIKFVIGHELGHFLLSHNIEEKYASVSQEGYIKTRAQEISVDRIGLLACKDIDVATQAIVKSLSGLNEKYVTFNMQAFLKQLDSDIAKKEESGQFSTHPSFILRAKALLRFSLSGPYLQHTKNGFGTNINEIDKLIQGDLNLYIDKDLRQDIKQSKKLLLFWGYAFAYIKGGSFSKENQTKLGNVFGQDMKEKLIKMVQNTQSDIAIKEVQDKFFSAINGYKTVAPNMAKKELNMMLMEIERETMQKNFFKEILQNI
tara:strand:+ start:1174 stop:2262 length:1089 start_codon:yes stop_codon:yes gene_type:complete